MKQSNNIIINVVPNNKSFLINSLNKYLNHYSGLPSFCWEKIILTFVNDLSAGICFFLSLFFVKHLNFNIAEAGSIISFYGLGTMLGGFYGGKLTDRFSSENVSVISLLIKAFIFILLAKLTSFVALAILIFTLGVVTYSFSISNNVWVLNHCKNSEPERLKAINILYTVSNFGMGISALLIGAFVPLGYNTVFYSISLLLLLSTLYLLFQNKKNKMLNLLTRHEPKTTIIDHSSTNPNKLIWLILTCVFFVGLIIAQRRSTYSIYIHNVFPTMGMQAISLLLALNPLIIIFCQVPLTNFISRHKKLLMIGIGAGLMGFGTLMLSFSYMFCLAILACVIYTLGEMLFISTAQLLCYQYGTPKKKAQSVGLFKTIFASSVIVGPFIGSSIYHHLNGKTLWYLCGVVGFSCFLACLISNMKIKI